MVQVKPNWHDSYELFGYVSRVSGKPIFVVGDFLRFVARAWAEPEIPYFLCLDEMNLAPVEQYFAEFLSVIESRKCNNGVVTTDPILRKEDTEWFFDLTASIAPNEEVRERFKKRWYMSAAKPYRRRHRQHGRDHLLVLAQSIRPRHDHRDERG